MGPVRYQISVRGRLTEHLGSAFAGMTMEPGAGQTALVGEIRDQSHLYGILDRVRSLGLELVSVEPFRTDQAGDQDERTRARHAEHEVMGPSSPAAARRRCGPAPAAGRDHGLPGVIGPRPGHGLLPG